MFLNEAFTLQVQSDNNHQGFVNTRFCGIPIEQPAL